MKITDIKINEKKRTMNARDLWTWLESGQDFSNWIKSRIEKYGFILGNDYAVDNFIEPNALGGQGKIEYHISIGMAKEISMVENNDKGKEARLHFIECERRLKAKQPINIEPKRPEILIAEALILSAEMLKEKDKQIAIMQPKADFHDAVTQSTDTIDMGEVAKILNFKKIGRNKLFKILRMHGILMASNQPYQRFIEDGYFKIVETKWTAEGGTEPHINLKTVVTQKGLNYILGILNKLKEVPDEV